MGYFIIVGLFFGVISLAVGLIGGVIYLCYLPFKRRLLKSGKLTLIHSRQINKVYVFVLFIIAVSQTYIVFFPTDSFYKEEFNLNTGLDLPSSADIIVKSSDIPDFHGDYEASALIRLDKDDFIKLKTELSKDTNFQLDTSSQPIGRTQSYSTVSKDIEESQIEVIYGNIKEEWFRVAFLKDGQTIIFERSST
jgi:hypothetical protein